MGLIDVADYWDKEPCNTGRGRPYRVGTKEFYDTVEKVRYDNEPTIPSFADFARWKGKKVLEVGCGLGTELTQFARAGADVTGIDISRESVKATNKRLKVYGLPGKAIWMDAESIEFDGFTFDLVYSWGVIHHSPNPQAVINEIHRVLKPNGIFKGMVYHRFSTMGFAVWVLDVLNYKNPFISLKTAFDRSMESPGTKAYSYSEVERLFGIFKELKLTPDYCAEYKALKGIKLYHILKVYPKQLYSWIRVEGMKI